MLSRAALLTASHPGASLLQATKANQTQGNSTEMTELAIVIAMLNQFSGEEMLNGAYKQGYLLVADAMCSAATIIDYLPAVLKGLLSEFPSAAKTLVFDRQLDRNNLLAGHGAIKLCRRSKTHREHAPPQDWSSDALAINVPLDISGFSDTDKAELKRRCAVAKRQVEAAIDTEVPAGSDGRRFGTQTQVAIAAKVAPSFMAPAVRVSRERTSLGPFCVMHYNYALVGPAPASASGDGLAGFVFRGAEQTPRFRTEMGGRAGGIPEHKFLRSQGHRLPTDLLKAAQEGVQELQEAEDGGEEDDGEEEQEEDGGSPAADGPQDASPAAAEPSEAGVGAAVDVHALLTNGTVKQLKAELKRRGKTVSGKKVELQERLREAADLDAEMDDDDEEEAAEEEEAEEEEAESSDSESSDSDDVDLDLDDDDDDDATTGDQSSSSSDRSDSGGGSRSSAPASRRRRRGGGSQGGGTTSSKRRKTVAAAVLSAPLPSANLGGQSRVIDAINRAQNFVDLLSIGTDTPIVVDEQGRLRISYADLVTVRGTLSLITHPDKGGDADAQSKVNAAYEVCASLPPGPFPHKLSCGDVTVRRVTTVRGWGANSMAFSSERLCSSWITTTNGYIKSSSHRERALNCVRVSTGPGWSRHRDGRQAEPGGVRVGLSAPALLLRRRRGSARRANGCASSVRGAIRWSCCSRLATVARAQEGCCGVACRTGKRCGPTGTARATGRARLRRSTRRAASARGTPSSGRTPRRTGWSRTRC